MSKLRIRAWNQKQAEAFCVALGGCRLECVHALATVLILEKRGLDPTVTPQP
jgi:hypothetical protein